MVNSWQPYPGDVWRYIKSANHTPDHTYTRNRGSEGTKLSHLTVAYQKMFKCQTLIYAIYGFLNASQEP